MTNIIFVLGVELVVCLALEGLAPEENTLFHGETNTLEEQGVLKSTKVLQMVVLAEVHMQATHAKREVLRELVNGAGCDCCSIDVALVLCESRVGATKVLRKMVQDGCQTVVLV